MISQLIFVSLFICSTILFTWRIRKVIRNINLGRDEKLNDCKSDRWKIMFRVALGQSKMTTRPVAAFFHILIYVGFIIVNIEVVEIIVDGIFGTHRFLTQLLPLPLYNFLIGSFEILALLVWVACIVFLLRRNALKLKRFWMKEMTTWPRTDANIILITEITLMTAFLLMNGTDHVLQTRGSEHYFFAGAFPVSSIFFSWLNGFSSHTLEMFERSLWWYHIIGIFAFLNYLPFSKHLHILLAFPNTWYSRLQPAGYFTSNSTVTNEVKLMLDPSATPATEITSSKFGAKDVNDLSWKHLMDAYSCTECGRCSSSCPANLTGKKLSPRKIMMDTRDRLEEVGKNIDKHGMDFSDNKSLLGDYITPEELWACTSCNACVQECPVNINPLSIITELRRYMVMEESKAPNELAMMMTNLENNQAPWQFSPTDRFNWAEGLSIPTMADMQASGETPKVLFWVGCAGSFDDRYKSVTRSFAKILTAAEIKFAVLGMEETCTGDPAKRAGNEFTAQMLALTSVTTLNNYGVKKIVTACPHCFNSIKNEFPDLGGNYEVIHHSTFLSQLLAEGKVKILDDHALKNQSITFHDSCYLGRANGIYEAPREVLDSLKVELKEMKKCRTTGLCCGAGGAQMFKEDEPGNERINIMRSREAIETGAKVIASACPFCMTMMSDGVKMNNHEEIKVKDLAELVADGAGLND